MPAGPAGGREREILTAIVETFIASGEPVGSRTLARSSREGLSAATIRNVMADLADAGFLEQPHTSAGRVPTAEAYRYYVEQLSGEAHLSHENQSIIQDTLTGVTDVQEFMERTSHVLSLISHSVGVTVATSGPAQCAGARLLFAARRSESAGGGGDALGSGARPGAAAGYSAGRSRFGGALHQRKFSRLDDGATCAPSWRGASNRNAASMTG
jgi:hypothetical protein